MIPAIESGWVESIHCFGGELGMDEYVAARSDIFFVGPDGSMRSNRAFSQTAGHYAIDMFIGWHIADRSLWQQFYSYG